MNPREPRAVPRDVMNCERSAEALVRVGTKVITLIFVFLALILAGLHSAAAMADNAPPAATQVLDRTLQYQLRFRQGDMQVIEPWIAMLEQATQAEPANPDLWYALGYAYLTRGAQALLEGKPELAMAAMQKGPAALRQSLKLNPDHPQALSQLGGIQTMLGPVLKLPAMAPRGVAMMNRSVALAPDSTRVRLMRAFAGPNLPAELRNTAAEAEDLDFLIGISEWGTAGDFMRIMRADLDFELGQPEQARAMYRSVEGTGSGASATAKERLAALDRGSVDMAAIRELRSTAGARCAMCHDR
jgi:hypothetical protein